MRHKLKSPLQDTAARTAALTNCSQKVGSGMLFLDSFRQSFEEASNARRCA